MPNETFNSTQSEAVTAVLRHYHSIAVAKTLLYISKELGLYVNMSEGYLGDTIAHLKRVMTKLQVIFDPTPHREDGGHAKGIAIDINVFTRDAQGKLIYLNNYPEHRCWAEIGRFWQSTHHLARWIPTDKNHLAFINKGII
jgi:hypothetical protein